MFARFPDKSKHPLQHDDWAKKCRREKVPSQYAVLCSAHFDESFIDRTGQIVRLRDGAVPNAQKFSIPDYLKVKPIDAGFAKSNKVLYCRLDLVFFFFFFFTTMKL